MGSLDGESTGGGILSGEERLSRNHGESGTTASKWTAHRSVDTTALQSKALRHADRLLVVVPDSRCFRENRSPPPRMPSPVLSRLPMCSPC